MIWTSVLFVTFHAYWRSVSALIGKSSSCILSVSKGLQRGFSSPFSLAAPRIAAVKFLLPSNRRSGTFIYCTLLQEAVWTSAVQERGNLLLQSNTTLNIIYHMSQVIDKGLHIFLIQSDYKYEKWSCFFLKKQTNKGLKNIFIAVIQFVSDETSRLCWNFFRGIGIKAQDYPDPSRGLDSDWITGTKCQKTFKEDEQNNIFSMTLDIFETTVRSFFTAAAMWGGSSAALLFLSLCSDYLGLRDFDFQTSVCLFV